MEDEGKTPLSQEFIPGHRVIAKSRIHGGSGAFLKQLDLILSGCATTQ